MFESSGEITPPWGVPPVVRVRTPLSSTPAFNHLSIIFRTTPSVTRWSRNLSQVRVVDGVEVFGDIDVHHPPQPLLHEPVRNARRASWAERPGRKPNEHGKKAVS